LLARELDNAETGMGVKDIELKRTDPAIPEHTVHTFVTSFERKLEGDGFLFSDETRKEARTHAEAILRTAKYLVNSAPQLQEKEKKMCFCLESHWLDNVDDEKGGRQRVHILNNAHYKSRHIIDYIHKSYKSSVLETDSSSAQTYGRSYAVCKTFLATRCDDVMSLYATTTDGNKTVLSGSFQEAVDENTQCRSDIINWVVPNPDNISKFKQILGAVATLRHHTIYAALRDNFSVDPLDSRGRWKYGNPYDLEDSNRLLAFLESLRLRSLRSTYKWLNNIGSLLHIIRGKLTKCPFGPAGAPCYTWRANTVYSRHGITHSGNPEVEYRVILELVRDFPWLLNNADLKEYEPLWTGTCNSTEVHAGPPQGHPDFRTYVDTCLGANTETFATKCSVKSSGGGNSDAGAGSDSDAEACSDSDAEAKSDSNPEDDCKIAIAGHGDAYISKAQWLLLHLPTGCSWLIVVRTGGGKTFVAIQMTIQQWQDDMKAGRTDRGYIIVVPGPQHLKSFEDQVDAACARIPKGQRRPYRVRVRLNPIGEGFKETYPDGTDPLSGPPGANQGPPIVMMTYADLRNLCHVHSCVPGKGASHEKFQKKLDGKFAIQTLFRRNTDGNFSVDPERLFVVCDEAHNFLHKLGSDAIIEFENTALWGIDKPNETFKYLGYNDCEKKEVLPAMKEFLGASQKILLTATPISIDEVSGDREQTRAFLQKSYNDIFNDMSSSQYVIAGLGTPIGSLLVYQLSFHFFDWNKLLAIGRKARVPLLNRNYDIMRAQWQRDGKAPSVEEEKFTTFIDARQKKIGLYSMLELENTQGNFVTWMYENGLVRKSRIDRNIHSDPKCVQVVMDFIKEVLEEGHQSRRVVVYFDSTSGDFPSGLVSKIMDMCIDDSKSFIVSSATSPDLNIRNGAFQPPAEQSPRSPRPSLEKKKGKEEEAQHIINRKYFNKHTSSTDPRILFYDYNTQTTSVDIEQVDQSIFLDLPADATDDRKVSVSAFAQVVGRGNRYGKIPRGSEHMRIKIFAGEWERIRCCALFSTIRSYQTAFEDLVNVTPRDTEMGEMYDLSNSPAAQTCPSGP
jgi:hypothetical protein